MPERLWKIGISVGVLLLLADVGVVRWQLNEMDVTGLRTQVDQLREEVGRLTAWEEVQVEEEDQASSSPSTTATPTPLRSAERSYGGAREVYIPLGSGSTTSQEWVNTAAQAYIDTSVYQIRAAYFEASLRADSGQVWARLINKNEGNYAVGSEISHNTPTGTLIRSGKIFLPEGNKLYVVQLKGETQQQVFVENARVRLLVQE